MVASFFKGTRSNYLIIFVVSITSLVGFVLGVLFTQLYPEDTSYYWRYSKPLSSALSGGERISNKQFPASQIDVLRVYEIENSKVKYLFEFQKIEKENYLIFETRDRKQIVDLVSALDVSLHESDFELHCQSKDERTFRIVAFDRAFGTFGQVVVSLCAFQEEEFASIEYFSPGNFITVNTQLPRTFKELGIIQ